MIGFWKHSRLTKNCTCQLQLCLDSHKWTEQLPPDLLHFIVKSKGFCEIRLDNCKCSYIILQSTKEKDKKSLQKLSAEVICRSIYSIFFMEDYLQLFVTKCDCYIIDTFLSNRTKCLQNGLRSIQGLGSPGFSAWRTSLILVDWCWSAIEWPS